MIKWPTNHTTYYWHGIDINGKKASGALTAKNKNGVRCHLLKNNIIPTTIQRNTKKIKKKNIHHIIFQLSLLVNAGIPISQACAYSADSISLPATKQLLLEIKFELESGISLAQAFKNRTNYFNDIDYHLIHSGEQSGQLGKALTELARYYQQRQHHKKKIIKILFYPCTVLSLAIMITAGIIKFIVPQFQQLFTEFGGHLPWLTQSIVTLSNKIQHNGIILILITTMVISISYYSIKKHPALTYFYHCCLLKIPFFGHVIKTQNLATWSQILAITSNAALPLLPSLQLAHSATHNRKITTCLNKISQRIEAGDTLYQGMEQCSLFTTPILQLIAIGENTGALGDMISKIATLYQQQLESLLDNLGECLEPLIMILLAILIGTLIIAMYLPVFRIGSAL